MARRDDDSTERIKRKARALNSKMSVVAQRMKRIEKNEKILAKTVTRNNKRIKNLVEELDKLKEKGIESGGKSEPEVSASVEEDLDELTEKIDELKKEMENNTSRIEDFEDKLDEMEYVVNMVNPVEYLTAGEISELVNERVEKALEEKESSDK